MSDSKADQKSLEALHAEVAKVLAEAVKTCRDENGNPEVAYLNAAIRFLKDNGIVGVPAKGSPLDFLKDQTLPFAELKDESDRLN